MTRKQRRDARAFPSVARDPARLALDISKEFTEAKYLWTGASTPDIHDLFATFCDPTLAFVGLDTFERNLKPAARPEARGAGQRHRALRVRAVGGWAEPSARLVAHDRQPERAVAAAHRPERTHDVHVQGLRERPGCLIVAYKEEWELSAGEAVAQLLRPSGGD